LRYTLTVNAAGGPTFSDAFDVSIIDTLGLGLLYSNNPSVAYTDTFNAPSLYANTIVAPATNGANGISGQQVLTWSAASGTDIDIGEGDTVTITYDVVVLDSVLANQSLSNSAFIQWTGIDGDYTGLERDGTNTVSAQGGLNDYFNGPQSATVVTPNNNTITKTRISDTYNNLTNDVRVGDVITYQLDLSLQEGLHTSFLVNDVLPQGLVFVGIQSINGDSNGADGYAAAAPFSYTSIPAGNITVSGDPVTGPTTLSINMGDVTNAGDNLSNNTLSIIYTARVLNNDVHPQVNNIALQNSVTFDYTTATGVTTSAASTAVLDLRQPTLTVTKTATQQFGDTIVVAGENITYTVTVTNTGTAPAYDMVLRDTLPFGMRLAGATTVSIETPIGSPLAIFAPTYDGVTGIAEWNFDNGVVADTYSIQPGQSLRIVYTAVVDATVGAGVTLNNSALTQLYYSFDDDAIPASALVTDREVYGPTAASVYSMTTPAPSPLAKLNPVNTDASIGQPFTYRITVPATPVATALYDVRILDDLGALAPNVDLIFVNVVKVSGSLPWVPVNTGTDTSLVIEDTTTGIDIPAGEQIEIDLTVVVRNTSNNSAGDVFQNTASYTYDSVNNDASSQAPGGGATTANMTIVEPLSMVLDKTAPVNMEYGTPGTYVIDVQNTGTGPAYDLTIIDHLPDPVAGGGMCDTAPNNFVVETRDA
ncbi:MAG TPA: isopeptide-forming domain-containing fimbrial protein, partial [Gammaproteobacteria bacterium]|nr:isopeptide-forming domain-containing fimbrial protein [Gammaproteobacteria bacterium]